MALCLYVYQAPIKIWHCGLVATVKYGGMVWHLLLVQSQPG